MNFAVYAIENASHWSSHGISTLYMSAHFFCYWPNEFCARKKTKNKNKKKLLAKQSRSAFEKVWGTFPYSGNRKHSGLPKWFGQIEKLNPQASREEFNTREPLVLNVSFASALRALSAYLSTEFSHFLHVEYTLRSRCRCRRRHSAFPAVAQRSRTSSRGLKHSEENLSKFFALIISCILNDRIFTAPIIYFLSGNSRKRFLINQTFEGDKNFLDIIS